MRGEQHCAIRRYREMRRIATFRAEAPLKLALGSDSVDKDNAGAPRFK